MEKIKQPNKKNGNKNNCSSSYPARNQLTFGQRASDKLTKFMGSWIFILMFLIILGIWMAINVVAWEQGWDPYPFILLNLCLSCLAAFQAPIILMSGNRQYERDRIEAKYDYAVNRKAEREIQEIKRSIDSIKRTLAKNK